MVKLASHPETSVAQIAREHSINDNLIFKWLHLWQNEGRISRRLPATVATVSSPALLPGDLVQHALEGNPFSGHLFIFRGCRLDMVKILWADAEGLCLFTKRLEEGQFVWPMVHDGKIAITRSQLAMLLDKLDWRQPKTPRFNSPTML